MNAEVGAETVVRPLLRSSRVGSLSGPSSFSVTTIRTLPFVQPVHPVDAEGVMAGALRGLLGHLGLGDQVALRRIRPGELDAGSLADDAPSSVAADEIPGPQRPAAGQRDVDAGVVLSEACHLGFEIDPHLQLGKPAAHDPLDLVLEDPEEIRMARREVAGVEQGVAERHRRMGLTLCEKPTGDPALVEDLDRARVDATGPRVAELVVGARLDDRHVDLRQRQLSRQHHSRRTTSGDHHVVLGHHDPVGFFEIFAHSLPPVRRFWHSERASMRHHSRPHEGREFVIT